MIKFFKDNLSIIIKLFLNRVGMVVFSLIVSIATLMIGNDIVFHIAGIVSILMYLALLYIVMWEKGAYDKIRIDSGRQKKNIFYGLYVSLCESSISILLAFITFITSFFVVENESSFVNDLYGICKIIMHYINAMYLSITSTFNQPNQSFVYILIILPSLVVCMLSYLAGISGMKCIFPEKRRK